MHKRARVLCNKAPFSTSLSVLCAADAWLDAVIDGRIEGLRLGGRYPQLALDLVAGLHLALFDFSRSRPREPTTASS